MHLKYPFIWAPESILQIMNCTEAREGLLFYKRGHTHKTNAHLSGANINTAAATQHQPNGLSSPGAFCFPGREDAVAMEGG